MVCDLTKHIVFEFLVAICSAKYLQEYVPMCASLENILPVRASIISFRYGFEREQPNFLDECPRLLQDDAPLSAPIPLTGWPST